MECLSSYSGREIGYDTIKYGEFFLVLVSYPT
jgi:hypothetical protein